MDGDAQRAALAALIERDGVSLATLSRVVGRNAAWVQQYLRRGSPRLLPEAERAVLACFFGVAESAIGGPAPAGGVRIARLDLEVSAGPGRVADDGVAAVFEPLAPDLAVLGVDAAHAAVMTVRGDSMWPTLSDGDRILVDRRRASPDRDPRGIWVFREVDMLHVKRLERVAGGWRIVSDNAPARTVAAGALAVIGRVVWMERRL